VVEEARALTLPATLAPGEYAIRVGVYVPDGARLLTETGAEWVRLQSIRVE